MDFSSEGIECSSLKQLEGCLNHCLVIDSLPRYWAKCGELFSSGVTCTVHMLPCSIFRNILVSGCIQTELFISPCDLYLLVCCVVACFCCLWHCDQSSVEQVNSGHGLLWTRKEKAMESIFAIWTSRNRKVISCEGGCD